MRSKIKEYEKRFPMVKSLRVYPSATKNKRFTAVFLLNGKRKVVNFGSVNGYTYLDGASKQKRDAYRARASKIANGKGMYTYRLPGTANSLSYWLLW